MNLTELTIAKTHEGLVKKEFSALELTKAFLDKIEDLDKKISAFITVTADSALSQAKKVDDLISQGKEIPILGGIPLAVKDNMMIEGVRCTAASKILENYIAPYDATVIQKLKSHGAVFLGKTNLDEFAMGASTENSAFGPTHNPRDLSRVPGGSSGGSAAAVAADLSVYALGSDTGGSIRQPASFCGIVGLKPTYGAVSRYGLIAMASSLDQIGPMTKNVADARIVFKAISGKDKKDSTSVELEIKDLRFKIKDLRIGVPKEYFIKGIDPEVEKSVKNAIKKLGEAGAKIQEISLPHNTDDALAVYYIIMPSEASTNLARYDGIKYGYSASDAKDLMDVYMKSRGKGFGKEVRRRIIIGTYALSSGYYEAYYLQAQKVRTKIIEDFNKAFKSIDVVIVPTAPTPAFKLGEKSKDPLSMYLADIFVTAVNLAGLPAISLPCGKNAKGLPIGLQIIGKQFEEDKILELGEFFEKL
ncbi:MAG: Asp-tRNA(Asn)/Glu-tRNA(Gln) amidotransferase subunit GatA [Candidatus Nealsonbacteria bacterium]|nr:Asp-tRNA(Asn)/Glu-tRNA(Gln) amidotransferase subunit GatA [Candidatus Nealsonbacteria bacterium]